MTAAFDALAAEHELVVLEGAGSPAEINLPDLVNNRMLAHADAAALLVSDIDRGGAFAHLYGTWALVPPADPRPPGRVRAQPLPRRRRPAGARPAAAHRADRDGLRRRRADAAPRAARRGGRHGARRPRARARSTWRSCAFPFGSNLDEFHLLGRAASVRVRRAPGRAGRRRPRRAAGLQARHRRPGLAARAGPGDGDRAGRGGRGRGCSASAAGARCSAGSIDDPDGVEGGRPGAVAGLGLLPFTTVFGGDKVTRRREVTMPDDLPAPWAALRGVACDGLRDPHGRTAGGPVWAAGNVLATTVHGLLEDPDVVERLVGRRPPLCWRRRSTSSPTPSTSTSTPTSCAA